MPDPIGATADVSVIVPVLDDATRLAGCLDALLRQVGAPSFAVVVVDNGSSDGSREVARQHPLAPVLVTEHRRGSYAARNAGIAAASGAMLAFTDADCLPDPDWVARGAAALESSPVVGGQIRPQASAAPTVWERYDRAVYLKQHDLVEQQGYAATANLWVRREVLDAVGRFDASLQSSGDLEWGHRAAAAGFPVSFAEDVVVAHAPRSTAVGTWRLHRRLGAGWAALRREHPELRAALWLPLGFVVDAVAADGPPLRRRQLLPVHLVAMGARRLGWMTRART